MIFGIVAIARRVNIGRANNKWIVFKLFFTKGKKQEEMEARL